MAVFVLILALVVGFSLLRRLRGPKHIVTESAVKQYRPDRAQFQRLPGKGRRRRRGL